MKFVIIGAGVAGCGTAEALAEAGHSVILIEKRNQLLSGTSDDTPCRLGLGFHYIDPKTAMKYLHSSISVLKKYPGFVVAKEKEQNHPHRRWRYFVVKKSLFPLWQIEKVYAELKEEYKRLVEEDESNKVLGDPDNFYSYLTVDEYNEIVNTQEVIAGIETAEQVLDWPLLKNHLTEEIENNKNITVLKRTEVTDARYSKSSAGFTIFTDNLENGEKQVIEADYVINCSWEQLERINKQAGFDVEPNSRTMRTKVNIEIKLPPGSEDIHPLNSMFFLFGAFCSFTNRGDGTGFITFEPVTNIEQTKDLTISERSNKLLYEKISEEDTQQYGGKILEGIIHYIPKLKGAEILGAKVGIVITRGDVDINSPSSEVHCRDYSGVESLDPRWICNRSFKLLHFLDNAGEVREIVNNNLPRDLIIEEVAKIVGDWRIKRLVLRNMQQYYSSDELYGKEQKISETICAVIENKKALLKHLNSANLIMEEVAKAVDDEQIKRLIYRNLRRDANDNCGKEQELGEAISEVVTTNKKKLDNLHSFFKQRDTHLKTQDTCKHDGKPNDTISCQSLDYVPECR